MRPRGGFRSRRRRGCSPATRQRSPARSPCWTERAGGPDLASAAARRPPRDVRCPCWASPAPAARASPRSTDELLRRAPHRPRGQAAHRVHLAIDPTRRTRRRRPARRPHPDELPRRRRRRPAPATPTSARWPPARGAADPRAAWPTVVAACKAAGFDLVVVETPGIGQGDAAIDLHVLRRLALRHDARVRCRVAAGEDRHARLRRRGGDQQVRTARRRRRPPRRRPPAGPQPRGVRRARGRTCRSSAPARPGSTTTASPRSTSTCSGRCWWSKGLPCRLGRPATRVDTKVASTGSAPRAAGATASRYLAEISRRRARLPRHDRTHADLARRRQHVGGHRRGRSQVRFTGGRRTLDIACIRQRTSCRNGDGCDQPRQAARALAGHSSRPTPATSRSTPCAARRLHVPSCAGTLSGNTRIPPRRAAALHRRRRAGRRFLRRENLPGHYFPYTAGVFPFKREGEAPARMFAGEGDAFRTNRRFQLLSARATRPPGCRPPSTR